MRPFCSSQRLPSPFGRGAGGEGCSRLDVGRYGHPGPIAPHPGPLPAGEGDQWFASPDQPSACARRGAGGEGWSRSNVGRLGRLGPIAPLPDPLPEGEGDRWLASRNLLVLAMALVVVLAAQSGCGPAGGAPVKITNRAADASGQWSEDLFSFALENLNHLEDNDCEEMRHSTWQRLAVLQQPNIAPGKLPPDALLRSWPEPDMLRQVVNRLNQWVDTQEKPAPWKPDPMLATLSADLGQIPMLQDLGEVHFTAYDGYMLMEAVWLRDASKWAGGGTADELRTACNLFDWTVRNLQTDYDNSDRVPQVPWETLFLGHGTSLEKAWTYILLLRQRGIDAVMLALPAESSSPAGKSPVAKVGKEPLKPWCVGVLIGDTEGEKAGKALYLFDMDLGLPVPGPSGIQADKSGRLDVQPATLGQVMADPKLLDRLALGADSPYWVRKADLKQVAALVEASPMYLAPRAKRIESRLTGERKLVLNAEPSQQAARIRAAGVGDVRLWDLPYTTLQRRLAMTSRDVTRQLLVYLPFMTSSESPLYKGRIMHLKGKLFDEKEAIAYYQKARPRNQEVEENMPKSEKADFEFSSQQWKKALDRDLTREEQIALKQRATLQAQLLAKAVIEGKLSRQLLAGPDRVRTRGIHGGDGLLRSPYIAIRHRRGVGRRRQYNIARTLEAVGKRDKAIEVYELSILLRNDRGNRVQPGG